MPRTGVQFVANDEPSFIKQFKQRIGHKEGPSIDTKRQIPQNDDDDDSDDAPEREDEKPVVVVLSSGDLTAEEADIAEKDREEGPARLDEKIVFRKPPKRPTTDPEVQDKAKDSIGPPKKKKDSNSKQHSSSKKTKNSSLLSFADEEDEEDV